MLSEKTKSEQRAGACFSQTHSDLVIGERKYRIGLRYGAEEGRAGGRKGQRRGGKREVGGRRLQHQEKGGIHLV